jgi:hypothetical protein
MACARRCVYLAIQVLPNLSGSKQGRSRYMFFAYKAYKAFEKCSITTRGSRSSREGSFGLQISRAGSILFEPPANRSTAEGEKSTCAVSFGILTTSLLYGVSLRVSKSTSSQTTSTSKIPDCGAPQRNAFGP